MKHLFYSEELKKYFDTEEECLKAEEEFKQKHEAELKLREEKAERAKEIKEAYKHYLELRETFIKDYGAWHMSLTEKDLPETSLLDLFDKFWF